MKNILKKFIVMPAVIIFIAVGIWQTSRWVKNIEISIEDLKEKYKNLDVRISKFDPISYRDTDESTEISEQEKEILGFCGHMNPNIITAKSKTSWGIRYYLNHNICELNEYYNWEKLGKYPCPGIFFKITNDFNNMSTWCISVGTFKDDKNPNRILIVSRKVANELGIPEVSFLNTSVRISLLKEHEWKSRRDCIDLYNLLEIKKMKLIF